MNIFEVLTGGKDYITLVKEFIHKVFVHEARKYHCHPHELQIVIDLEETGKMIIMTYSKPENRIWRVIPDKEVQDILTK